jgi:hypothetical protein
MCSLKRVFLGKHLHFIVIDICCIIDFIIELNLLRGDYEDIFDECSVHLYLQLTLFVGVFMSYSCYLCLFTYGGV